MRDLRKIHESIARLANSTLGSDVLTKVDDDDCAAVSFGDQTLVITTDFINSRPAIVELGSGSWYDLGQLAVCHNLADLAGSGCKPLFYLSGLSVPVGTLESEILDFTNGVCDACSRHNCSLIGGDTKFGSFRSIYGTALGTPLGPNGPFLRNGAKPGDRILLSKSVGTFAAAVVGLSQGELLLSPKEREWANSLLLSANVSFELPRYLATLPIACSGTDLSDGLGTDILDICRSSGLTAYVDESCIPIDDLTLHVSDRLGVPAWKFAFASGGDFACAFSVASEYADGCSDCGGVDIGSFSAGKPAIRSVCTGRMLPLVGHQADRQRSFAEEILTNVTTNWEMDGN